MEELKPCPFCGGEAQVKTWMDEDVWSHNIVEWKKVDCLECEVQTGSTCEGYEVSAVEAWNTRHVS